MPAKRSGPFHTPPLITSTLIPRDPLTPTHPAGGLLRPNTRHQKNPTPILFYR